MIPEAMRKERQNRSYSDEEKECKRCQIEEKIEILYVDIENIEQEIAKLERRLEDL